MEYETMGEARGEQNFIWYPFKLIMDNPKSLKV
jgi:hypothetical protein